MEFSNKVILALLTVFGLVFLIAFFHAFLITICWNYLMPKLFNLARITYWDGYVMAVLSSCLFKTIRVNNQ